MTWPVGTSEKRTTSLQETKEPPPNFPLQERLHRVASCNLFRGCLEVPLCTDEVYDVSPQLQGIVKPTKYCSYLIQSSETCGLLYLPHGCANPSSYAGGQTKAVERTHAQAGRQACLQCRLPQLNQIQP